MIVRKITLGELQTALAAANLRYKSNLCFGYEPIPTGSGFRFVLRLNSSKGPGHRLSQGRTSKGNRRRLAVACYHAYWRLMECIFDAAPGASIHSCQAKYDSRQDLDNTAEITGNKNVGSMMDPLCYADACECEAS